MRKKLAVGSLAAAAVVLATATPAFAQDATEVVFFDLTSVFIFFCAVLVFFMGAGFAFLETGLSRAKSAAHMMMKNLITVSIGVLSYWAIGAALAYGSGGDITWIGWGNFFLADLVNDVDLDLGMSAYVDWFYGAAFAATAATIISGAMAERTKLSSYVIITVAMTAVIYPIVVAWTWGGGWLDQLGTPFLDFAGSAIVHMTGGVAGLVGTILLGARLGKYVDGKPRVIPAHSVPFAVVGTFILWFGWYGFNVGSALTADAIEFGPAIATTTLAAAAGALTAMAVTWIRYGKSDVSMTANGALAGLVGITAGAGYVDVWASVVIGVIAGIIVVFSVTLLDRSGVDDPVGAVSVHGVCGVWGTLAVGLFLIEQDDGTKGLFLGGGFDQLLSQIIGVVAIAVFVAIAAFIVFSIVKAVIGLRVTEDEEMAGLDIAEHGAPGYGDDIVVGTAASGSGGEV